MKIVLFANTEWYLYNFRRSLALALRDSGHEALLLSPPGFYGSKLRGLGLRWEPVPIRTRWREHLSGKRNWQHHLWDVLMFQTWLGANEHG